MRAAAGAQEDLTTKNLAGKLLLSKLMLKLLGKSGSGLKQGTSAEEMALYKYPGYETGQGWTMKPGNLEGGFWGRFKGILGASPPIFAYWSPQNPPSRFQGFIVLH